MNYRVLDSRNALYLKVGHFRQVFRRSFRRWAKRRRSVFLSMFDLIEKPARRHAGLPEDLRGLSGKRFWSLRMRLVRSSIRASGIDDQVFQPLLDFFSSARRFEWDTFQKHLESFFLQFEDVAKKRIATRLESALSDYRFLSSRGLAYSSYAMREAGLALLAEEIEFSKSPAKAMLLRIGMGDFPGARQIYELTRSRQQSASFEYAAISKLFTPDSNPCPRKELLDPYLSSLVEGRRIHIVGPGSDSPSESVNSSKEALVLRFEEARRLPQLQRTTDIGWEDSNPSRKTEKFIGDQKVLLVNYPEFMGRFKGPLPPVIRQARFQGLGGYGLPLGATRAILNLLPYGPSEIYVTGIDFFLAESQYEEGYGGPDQEDELFHHWSLMHGHDLLSNLNLGRALAEYGMVKGDAAFVRAINTPSDVASRIYDNVFWRRLYTRSSRKH